MESGPLHLFCGVETGILARLFDLLKDRHHRIFSCNHPAEVRELGAQGEVKLLAISGEFALSHTEALNDCLAAISPELVIVIGTADQHRQLDQAPDNFQYVFFPESYDVPGILLLIDAYLEAYSEPRGGLKRQHGGVQTALNQLRKILNIGIWEVDLETGKGSWSTEVYDLFDLPPGKGEIDFETFFSRIHPDDQEKLMQARQRALDGDGPLNIEHRVVSAGKTRWVWEYGELIMDPQGETRAFAGVVIDVTNRRLIEEELHRSSQLEALGLLVGGVAHNFNNLLTVILGNAEDLSSKLRESPEIAEQLKLITDSSIRGAQVIRELLLYSREQQLNPEGVDVNALLDRLGRLLRYTLGRSLNLAITCQEGAWPAMIDPAKLENSIVSLALNAKEAMRSHGEIAISTVNLSANKVVRDYPQMRPANYVAIIVKDSGPGIAPELLSRVTEPFFTTKSAGQRSGLGLAEIKRFLRNSQGQLFLESQPGKGTTATVLLPAADTVTFGIASDGSQSTDGSGIKVIVAMSDLALRRNTVDSLTAKGFHAIEAVDSTQAQSAILNNPEARVLVWDLDDSWEHLGSQIMQSVLRANNDLKVLLATPTGEAFPIESSRYQSLPSPITSERLMAALQQLLDSGKG